MTNWRLRIGGVPAIMDQWGETMTTEQVATAVAGLVREEVRKAKAARPPALTNRDTLDLDTILDELSAATTSEEFDYAMSALYDWADDFAVWIEPVSGVKV